MWSELRGAGWLLSELNSSTQYACFTISHQFENYSKLKSNVTENAAIMVMDFSENYTCVNTRAVQSAHFGESNNQITAYWCCLPQGRNHLIQHCI